MINWHEIKNCCLSRNFLFKNAHEIKNYFRIDFKFMIDAIIPFAKVYPENRE
jgi:hypothetical protein